MSVTRTFSIELAGQTRPPVTRWAILLVVLAGCAAAPVTSSTMPPLVPDLPPATTTTTIVAPAPVVAPVVVAVTAPADTGVHAWCGHLIDAVADSYIDGELDPIVAAAWELATCLAGVQTPTRRSWVAAVASPAAPTAQWYADVFNPLIAVSVADW